MNTNSTGANLFLNEKPMLTDVSLAMFLIDFNTSVKFMPNPTDGPGHSANQRLIMSNEGGPGSSAIWWQQYAICAMHWKLRARVVSQLSRDPNPLQVWMYRSSMSHIHMDQGDTIACRRSKRKSVKTPEKNISGTYLPSWEAPQVVLFGKSHVHPWCQQGHIWLSNY